MSIVGTRPPLISETNLYEPHHKAYVTVHTSYIVNFDFTNNITILTGSSGTGKTASFSFMRECMAVNPDIVCINYQDYQKDIKKLVSSESGKLIVIDNADILLDDDTRKYISTDDNFYCVVFSFDCFSSFILNYNLWLLFLTSVSYSFLGKRSIERCFYR